MILAARQSSVEATEPNPPEAPRETARYRRSQAGFTLVELLIVVVILSILAGIVVPKLISPTEDAKSSALEGNLAIMNKAIEIYSLEHRGNYPGTIAAETTWDNFVQQMTLPTNRAGNPGASYGPYLRTGVAPANQTIAWLYDATNGVIYGRSGSGGAVIFDADDAVPHGGADLPSID